MFTDFGVTNHVPLEYMIQGIGRQRPREFSISSPYGGVGGSGEIDLTVAITEYETQFKRQITGVCSGFLKRASINSIVPVWLKKGTMTFPRNKPLILVSPGTGIAAMRAAIWELKNA